MVMFVSLFVIGCISCRSTPAKEKLEVAIQQQEEPAWTEAILIPNQQKIPIYKDSLTDKVVGYIMNDTVKERFYSLEVLSKQINGMFKIRAELADGTNYFPTQTGWINANYVGIYLRQFLGRDVVPIYERPDTAAKYFNIFEYGNLLGLVKVVEFKGTWVKVKFMYEGKAIEGWVAKENQYRNPY